jgi:glycosyltransferase involved in cell wall biosynthesis
MKVLSIGSDTNLLVEGSSVRERMKLIGQACEELHIIVPGRGNVQKISPTVFVHPTNTTNPLLRIHRAISVGCALPHCDLVTAQDPFEYGIAAFALGKKLGVPVEIQVHADIGSSFFGRGYSWQEIRNKIRMIGVGRRLKRAASVRVVSERVARAVENLGINRERITILPMYIDVKKFTSMSNTPAEHEKSILMVGRLEKEKDHPTAFRAFARVLRTFPEARLFIAGEGSLRAQLVSQAQKHNIAHAVVFLGAVSDITSHLASAHVLLHTSRYEGFGAVIAEAALVGVPIVSTDVGIAGTVLKNEEHAYILPVDAVGKIADALVNTLSHPQRAHERALHAAGVVASLLLSSEEYVSKLKKNWGALVQ